MKTILYCRVSTSDQILDHQVTQARAARFEVDEVVSDIGVSGVSTRLAERDQGKRLFDLLRRGDVSRSVPLDRPTLGKLCRRDRGHPGVHEARHRHSDRDQRSHFRWRNQRPNADGGPRCADLIRGRPLAGASRGDQRSTARWDRARQGPTAPTAVRKPSFTRPQLIQVRDLLTGRDIRQHYR